MIRLLEHIRKGPFIDKFVLLLPSIYIISPLSILGIAGLRVLNSGAVALLVMYAFSQIFPSLIIKDPAYPFLGGFIKTLFIMGLIGLGCNMNLNRTSIYMSIGLCFVIVFAFSYSFLTNQNILYQRLAHPYMTSTTLGIAGSLIAMSALFADFSYLQKNFKAAARLGFAFIGCAGVVSSGSRGAIICLISGSICALLLRYDWKKLLYMLLSFLIVGCAAYISGLFKIELFNRLLSLSGSGRELIWDSVRKVITENPLSGVGTYQLGKYLEPQTQCTLWVDKCPEWISNLILNTGKPWLIAHNAALQQLSETGIIGFFGLALLLGVIAKSALNSQNSMAISIIFGFFFVSGIDNLLIVPSPFFSEFFWIVSGWSISNGKIFESFEGNKKYAKPRNSLRYFLERLACYYQVILFPFFFGIVIVSGFLLPVVIKYLHTYYLVDREISLMYINIARSSEMPNEYRIGLEFSATPSEYKILVLGCRERCLPVATKNILIPESSDQSGLVYLNGFTNDSPTKFQIRIYKVNSSQNPAPVGIYEYSAHGKNIFHK